ncbi:acetate--CoA ligase family protein [Dasania marina]|uniref:acetate--CoA ligase family protein n=1 Tax=Dasania marina TaxID=471499 RepID=UPI0004770D13|nr:acetate--CoA ligase family protein [Dasania marina]
MADIRSQDIGRLFSPKSIAFVGGSIAEMSIRRCVEMGYQGEIWPVHPKRETLAGYKCYASIADLPSAPDAAYIGINRELSITVVGQLASIGAGGCVCYAAGFGEVGEEGQDYQDQLIAAAGNMPLVGPNCFGFVNFMERCALWPYLFGGDPVAKGPALISQSGNIAMNLTMNQRSVNFTYVIATGNQAVMGAGDYIDALLLDERVTAIGMYVEGFDDIEKFSKAALKAMAKGVPIVVLKVGKTEASARQTSSHTSSLAGSDTLYDALFTRLGVIRVDSLNRLLETLKLLDTSPPLRGNNIFSLSCSGGEAAMISDLVPEHHLEMLPFSPAQIDQLRGQLPNYVTISNPFDYNTSIWGDQAAQTDVFTAAMSGNHDAAFLIYDHPTVNGEEVAKEVAEWIMTLDAFIAAHKATGIPAFVVCTISELLPKELRSYLISHGVVPLQGFDDALFAYSAALKHYQSKQQQITLPRFPEVHIGADVDSQVIDEYYSKIALKEFGLTIPAGGVGTKSQLAEIADKAGYPVVLKAVGPEFLHKSDMGAVILKLNNAEDVADAADSIIASTTAAGVPATQFLVESMVAGSLAELIIGINRDDQFGPALIIGAGGILVELVADSVSLLLPTSRSAVKDAINSLSVAKLIGGFRGQKKGDLEAAIDAVMAVAHYAEANWNKLLELDINPLMILPEGSGVVAADALIIQSK